MLCCCLGKGQQRRSGDFLASHSAHEALSLPPPLQRQAQGHRLAIRAPELVVRNLERAGELHIYFSRKVEQPRVVLFFAFSRVGCQGRVCGHASARCGYPFSSVKPKMRRCTVHFRRFRHPQRWGLRKIAQQAAGTPFRQVSLKRKGVPFWSFWPSTGVGPTENRTTTSSRPPENLVEVQREEALPPGAGEVPQQGRHQPDAVRRRGSLAELVDQEERSRRAAPHHVSDLRSLARFYHCG